MRLLCLPGFFRMASQVAYVTRQDCNPTRRPTPTKRLYLARFLRHTTPPFKLSLFCFNPPPPPSDVLFPSPVLRNLMFGYSFPKRAGHPSESAFPRTPLAGSLKRPRSASSVSHQPSPFPFSILRPASFPGSLQENSFATLERSPCFFASSYVSFLD